MTKKRVKSSSVRKLREKLRKGEQRNRERRGSERLERYWSGRKGERKGETKKGKENIEGNRIRKTLQSDCEQR